MSILPPVQVEKWLNFTNGDRTGNEVVGVMTARFYEATVLQSGALTCFGWRMGNCTSRVGHSGVVAEKMMGFNPWDAVDCW